MHHFKIIIKQYNAILQFPNMGKPIFKRGPPNFIKLTKCRILILYNILTYYFDILFI